MNEDSADPVPSQLSQCCSHSVPVRRAYLAYDDVRLQSSVHSYDVLQKHHVYTQWRTNWTYTVTENVQNISQRSPATR